MFVEEGCDRDRTDKTRRLARLLLVWPSTDLEIAATIDYGERRAHVEGRPAGQGPLDQADAPKRQHCEGARRVEKAVREMDVLIKSVRR